VQHEPHGWRCRAHRPHTCIRAASCNSSSTPGEGMRIGQALGLRHSDFVSHRREVHIVPRANNANRARAKVRSAAVVPVSAPLVRLYSEYMHTEYGEVGSDYVFVGLFAGRAGRPMGYSAVHKLIGRVGARAGVNFNAHMLRHSPPTWSEISDVAPTASFDVVRDQGPIRVLGFSTVAAAS
jgi:integrase